MHLVLILETLIVYTVKTRFCLLQTMTVLFGLLHNSTNYDLETKTVLYFDIAKMHN